MEILIGNSFSMTLIRNHQVTIKEIKIGKLKALASSDGVVSYWGHENTRKAAEEVVGCSLMPTSERPAITLDENFYPQLDGKTFRQGYVLSPEYRPGFRPAIGTEVSASDIVGWHALKLSWK